MGEEITGFCAEELWRDEWRCHALAFNTEHPHNTDLYRKKYTLM
jgi:hypothetical protein